MVKRRVRLAGSDRVVTVDTDPQLKAVIGENVYLPDGQTLLDLNSLVNSTTTTVDVPVTTTVNGVTTTTTQKKVLGRLPQPISQSSLPFVLPATTKGDLMIHNGSMVVRFPVGPPGSVLIADPTTATGERWASAASLMGFTPMMMAMDGADGFDSFIPGQPGTAGTAGTPGATGAQGPAGQTLLTFDGTDGLDAFAMPSTALGDLSGMLGSIVKVTGFAGTPINTLPSVSGQIWIYRAGTNIWNAFSLGGDVTMSFTGTVTIAANAVDNSKLAQMPANTIKLNNTPATANTIDGTPAQLAQMLSGLMPAALAFDGNDGLDALPFPVPQNFGNLIKITAVTAGTTFQVSAGTNFVLIELVGGGGGGGGASSAAVSAALGGGGGSGSYSRKFVAVSPNATYTVAIGAAGAQGSVAGGNGGAGGNTTWAIGAATYTAGGGAGGVGMTAAATALAARGGAGGAAGLGTAGDFDMIGNGGGIALRISGTVGFSGGGAPSCFGEGKVAIESASAGTSGSKGSGGSGGTVINGSAAVTGGLGGAGLIIVWEFS